MFKDHRTLQRYAYSVNDVSAQSFARHLGGADIGERAAIGLATVGVASITLHDEPLVEAGLGSGTDCVGAVICFEVLEAIVAEARSSVPNSFCVSKLGLDLLLIGGWRFVAWSTSPFEPSSMRI